jgi:hypothetical protein
MLEHPGRDLQKTIGLRAAQRTPEDDVIRLRDRFMDRDLHPRPRMKRIEELTENGPVGVLKSSCTI